MNRLRSKMGKKAQSIPDLVLWVVVIGILGSAFVFLAFLNDRFETALLNTTVINSSAAARNVITSGYDKINGKLDYVVFVIAIGMALGFIILGWFIPVESIFFVFYVIGATLGMPMAFIIQHFWIKFTGSLTMIATRVAYFPITTHLMDNIGIYYTVVMGIALIVTYAKPGQQG